MRSTEDALLWDLLLWDIEMSDYEQQEMERVLDELEIWWERARGVCAVRDVPRAPSLG